MNRLFRSLAASAVILFLLALLTPSVADVLPGIETDYANHLDINLNLDATCGDLQPTSRADHDALFDLATAGAVNTLLLQLSQKPKGASYPRRTLLGYVAWHQIAVDAVRLGKVPIRRA